MISKQQAKFIKSLKLKKYRHNAESFLVEGAKNILELLSSDYEIRNLYLTDKFLDEYAQGLRQLKDFQKCSAAELGSLGTFKTNEYALAVASIKPNRIERFRDDVILALDDVRDPGNLGTIVRIADWYGIKNIVASKESADFYNPKVINASMGSFTRVDVHYMDLEDFFINNNTYTVYGALLKGTHVQRVSWKKPAVILMGNESEGIKNSLISMVDQRITIPGRGGAESLNVAVSTAIICDRFFGD